MGLTLVEILKEIGILDGEEVRRSLCEVGLL
jgi:hypothetical protein